MSTPSRVGYILLILRMRLEWMKRRNGKREIEAICDTWQGGLISYLIWKINRYLLHISLEETPIDSMDLEDDYILDITYNTDAITYNADGIYNDI